MYALEVRDLHKSYAKGFIPKRTEILKGISFSIPEGTIAGFLGSNGAGKTSTLKCVLGLAQADRGEILYFGQPGLSRTVKAQIGFLPERPYFYEYLTGFEFLRFYGEISTTLNSRDLRARIDALLKRVGLTHASDRRLRFYSKGMLQRVGLAQALIHQPRFVILDEPMAGLDPDGRVEVAEIIRETARNGTTVFFSSHLLNDAEKICDQLVIINHGKTIFNGLTKELMSRVATHYELSYVDGGVVKSDILNLSEDLQAQIDKLRSARKSIVEVRRVRKSLEEVFVEMSQGGPQS